MTTPTAYTGDLEKELRRNKILRKKNQNYYLNCSFCRERNKKLRVKKMLPSNRYMFHCFKCDTSGILDYPTLQALIRWNTKTWDAKKKTTDTKETKPFYSGTTEKSFFHPLLIAYLKKDRKFTNQEITRMVNAFGIYWCDDAIYFTSFFREKPIFLFKKILGKKGYLNQTGSKFPFNFNAVFNNRVNYVILVEGVFDAIRLCVNGFNAMAMLGKSLGTRGLLTFERYISDKRIIIMLDGDITDNEDKKLKVKLQNLLPRNEIKRIRLPGGDPDEYFQEEKRVQKLQGIINCK